MKEDFKKFVKSHPELVSYVDNKTKSWQDFYELFSLYGENSNIWNEYIKKEEKLSLTDLIETVKKVDVDSLQKNINNINKGIALIESLITKNPEVNSYTPAPIYKKFED